MLLHRRWIYSGWDTRRSAVDLYHHTGSGNLAVYCNEELSLMAPAVQGRQSFHLFLDDELCRIDVAPAGGGFEYEFSIVKDLPTPLNLVRRRKERRELLKIWTLVSMVSLIVVGTLIASFVFDVFDRRPPKLSYATYGITTSAKVTEQPLRVGFYDAIVYEYHLFKDTFQLLKFLPAVLPKQATTPYGMPLKQGDDFLVRVIRIAPLNHEVFFSRPSIHSLNRYQKEYFAKALNMSTVASLECRWQLAIEVLGYRGISRLHHEVGLPAVQVESDVAKKGRGQERLFYALRLQLCSYR